MTLPHRHNYLRKHRKRLALSQEDVAFLLGANDGTPVCRHEMSVSEPSLPAILAYEIIYQRSAKELFPGLYREVEERIATRAKTLTYRVNRGKSPKREVRHRETIVAIANKIKQV